MKKKNKLTTGSSYTTTTFPLSGSCGAVGMTGYSGSIGVTGCTTTTANITSGTTLYSSGGTWISGSWGSNDITDFCEVVLSALGHDITYDEFCKLSNQERKALLRDIKIKRILD